MATAQEFKDALIAELDKQVERSRSIVSDYDAAIKQWHAGKKYGNSLRSLTNNRALAMGNLQGLLNATATAKRVPAWVPA